MASRELVQFLREVDAFSAFKDPEIEQLASAAQFKSYELGERVFEQGVSVDGLYIIHTGKFRLFEDRDGTEQSMGLRGPGELIGEIGALQDVPLEYAVRSSSRSELLCIPRDEIAKIASRNREAEGFLKQYIIMASTGKFVTRFLNLNKKVSREELEKIVNSIGIKKIAEGQTILEQGSDEDRRLYVVQSGLVRLKRDHKGQEFTIGVLGEEEIFGEKACLEDCAHEESAIAAQDSLVFILPPETVKLVCDRTPSLSQLLIGRIESREREFKRQQKMAERRSPRIMIDLFSKSGMGDNVLKRFPLVEQAEEMDCGAACLAMICKYYKIPMTLGKLREMANVSREGATMDSLAKVGESLGFSCKGMRCTYKMLQTFDMPFIAHWEGYHYIIVYGISKKHVWIADPGPGFRKLTVEEFEKGWNGNCLLFQPTDAVYQVDTGVQKPWTRFFRFVIPHKRIIRDMFVATLVIEMLGLVSPLLTQAIIDKVVVHSNKDLLNVLIIGAVIAMAFTNITSLVRVYLSNFLIKKMDFAMMSQFYKHILALPLSFFSKRKTGDIMARFNENETIRDFLTDTSISTILNVFMLFIYLGVMLVFNIQLSLIFLAFVPFMVILTLYSTPKYKYYARRTFYSNAESESLLMESLAAAETIKGMGVERPMRIKWEKKYADVVNIRQKSEMFTAGIGAASQILNFGVMTTILYFGAKLVISQELTIGQLVAFNQLAGSVMSPIMGLIGTWDELHEAGVSMERLGDVLDLDPEQKPTETTQRIVIPDLQGAVRFDNVYFRYGGAESPYVLKNINFEMEAGKTYAFVGGSGSGKTTLAKVLVGFYPPTEGSIYVDGYDQSNVDLNSFRAQIGYVMQSNILFSGTVSENIALGDQDPDQRRILEVSRMADAHDFISNTALGYQMQVGERGVGLSGGQIQRICIARALYHDPRLIVLDEATSALDTQTENVIQENMEKVLANRTAVVIAHRLSTVMNADKIFVMFEGSITEQGTHEELLAKRGMYFHLVKNQLAGYKAEELASV